MCWCIISVQCVGATVHRRWRQYILHMCVCVLYLSAVVVLCHTVLLVDEEGMEDVEVEERGPSSQHQSVLSDVQNQRARRWLHRRQVHPAETTLSFWLSLHSSMMYRIRWWWRIAWRHHMMKHLHTEDRFIVFSWPFFSHPDRLKVSGKLSGGTTVCCQK